MDDIYEPHRIDPEAAAFVREMYARGDRVKDVIRKKMMEHIYYQDRENLRAWMYENGYALSDYDLDEYVREVRKEIESGKSTAR